MALQEVILNTFTFGEDVYTVEQIQGQRYVNLREQTDNNNNKKKKNQNEIYIDSFEVYIFNIPRFMSEQELVPTLYNLVGRFKQLRLLMCFSGCNRGYGFLLFETYEKMSHAIAKLQDYEICPKHCLFARRSKNTTKLILGGISESMRLETISMHIKNSIQQYDFQIKIIVFNEHKRVALINFTTHRDAALARRRLISTIDQFGPYSFIKWFRNN